MGAITFAIISILAMVYLYKKKEEDKNNKYISIDDQPKYHETIPNYRSVV